MKKSLLIFVIALVSILSYSQKDKKFQNPSSPGSIDMGLSTNVFYLSANGAISDADIGINSMTFGTDNTSAIQNVLDKAKSNPIIVYWDGKYSVTGLKVYSNTKIIAFEGCGAILRNNSDKHLLENGNMSSSSYGNSNISIWGGIWNGNGFNDDLNPAQIHDNPQVGWICTFCFLGVENLSIKDVVIYKPRTFALNTCNVRNIFIQNVRVDVGESAPINCDGLHINGPSENIIIKDCIIRAKDDHISIQADYAKDNHRPLFGDNDVGNTYGDITDVTIDNIKLEGGLFGIRLLSRENLIDKIRISNIHGITKEYWLIVDNYFQGEPRVTNPGKGKFGTIIIEDINVESTGRFVSFTVNNSYANIHANVECIVFKTINRNSYNDDNFPSILVTGEGRTVKKLIIEGYNASESTVLASKTSNHIEINGARVKYLSISNSNVTRDHPANSSPLLCVKNEGYVDCLQLDNIYCDGINNIVDVQGAISLISATNIIHMNATEGEGTFKAAGKITIPDLVLTNYTGVLPTSGEGTFVKTRGDGFTKSSVLK